MTTFVRRSYIRYSKYGVPHTVRSSYVERNDWSRSGSQHESLRDYYRRQLRDVAAGASAAATFINPNARCPVCGAPVYYYQNQFGSRVFFDDIGKPWPKHPCTDNSRFTRTTGARSSIEEPSARSIKEAEAIASWLGPAELDPEGDHKTRYGSKAATPYVLERKLHTNTGCVLVLVPIRARARPLFIALDRAPRGLREGSIVFKNREVLAYFDLRTMTDKEIAGERLPSAEAFVKELLRGRD